MCTQHSFVATLFYIELVCRLFSFLMCPFGSVYVCVSHNLPSKPFYLWHRFNTGHGVAPRRSNCSSLWWIAENSIKTYRTTGITSAILSLLPIYWYQFYRAHGNTLTLLYAQQKSLANFVRSHFFSLLSFVFSSPFYFFSMHTRDLNGNEGISKNVNENIWEWKQSSEEQLSSVANWEYWIIYETWDIHSIKLKYKPAACNFKSTRFRLSQGKAV